MANHDITEDTECKHFVIEMCEQRPDRKTREYMIINHTQGSVIATITWYRAWRQYCLSPGQCTIWSSGCLADIHNFLNRLNEKKPKP